MTNPFVQLDVISVVCKPRTFFNELIALLTRAAADTTVVKSIPQPPRSLYIVFRKIRLCIRPRSCYR